MPRSPRFDRQVALDSAVELFWSRGYYASSMKHIESALDMRPGSLYATFGSKSGLFDEALEAYALRSDAVFQQHIAESSSVLDGLQAYLRALVLADSQPQAPNQTCMLVKSLLEINPEDSALQSKADAMLALFERNLRKVLEQAQACGELRAEVDCPRLARLLQVQIMGLRAFTARKVPAAQIAEVADDMASLLDAYRAS